MYNYSKNELSTLRLDENIFSEPLKVLLLCWCHPEPKYRI